MTTGIDLSKWTPIKEHFEREIDIVKMYIRSAKADRKDLTARIKRYEEQLERLERKLQEVTR